jgi:hypothetical protein
MDQANDPRAATALKAGRRAQVRATDLADRVVDRDQDSQVAAAAKVGRHARVRAIASVGRVVDRDRDSRVAVVAKAGRRARDQATASQDLVMVREAGVPQVLTREELGANRSEVSRAAVNRSDQKVREALAEPLGFEELFP